MKDGVRGRIGKILEKQFQLEAAGTNVRTEILAGVTTFVTLAYILFVNPSILKDAGVPMDAAFAATCLASAFATLVMGLVANYPIAVAPGMGLNAFFTYTICVSMGVAWRTALGAVFISGLVFFLLTVTKIREWLVRGVPLVLRQAIGVGVGLFIGFIGLKNAGIVVHSDATLVTLGNVAARGTLVACAGLIFSAFLMTRRIKGALLIGIVATTVLAMATGACPHPHGIGDVVRLTNPFAALAPTFLQLDVAGALRWGLTSILFSLTFVDLFDNVGTLIGVARKAQLLDSEGQLPRIGRALFADSLGTMVGAMLGTSTVTSYVESAAGVAEGGRTGLTAVTVAAGFLLATVFSPLVALVPAFATAPALLLVGVLMMQEVVHIEWSDLTAAIPAFLTIVLMPLTFSIAQGLAFGFMSYTIVKLVCGRWRDNNAVTYTLSILFVFHFVWGR